MEPRKSVEIILRRAPEGHYTVFVDEFAVGVVHFDIVRPEDTLRKLIHENADVITVALAALVSDGVEQP